MLVYRIMNIYSTVFIKMEVRKIWSNIKSMLILVKKKLNKESDSGPVAADVVLQGKPFIPWNWICEN